MQIHTYASQCTDTSETHVAGTRKIIETIVLSAAEKLEKSDRVCSKDCIVLRHEAQFIPIAPKNPFAEELYDSSWSNNFLLMVSRDDSCKQE